MSAALLVLFSALTGQPACHDTLPTDPLQRCATRALAGEWGPLKDWQRDGYKQAIVGGATVQGTAWVTGYYPWECMHRDHKTGKMVLNNTRSGRKPTLRSAAVRYNAFDAQVFQYCWTEAYGMRVVEDSGAERNARVARGRGADIWLDYYWKTRHGRNPVTAYAIFGRQK